MKKSSYPANILFCVTSLFWFSQYSYTSYVNPELQKMGATAVFMGFAASAYGFTQLMLRIPVGIMSDKWQKKFFICAGSFAAGLSSLCMLVFYTPAALLVGRALSGVAAASWVAFTVLYSSYFKPEESTRTITMINVANQLGRLLSFALAGLFVAYFGPKASFTLSMIGGFLAFILSLFITEEKVAGRKPVRLRDLLGVAANRNLLTTSLLAVFIQIVSFSTYFSFTSNYAVSIGVEGALLSYMNVVLIAPGVVLNFIVSKHILRYVREKYLICLGFLFTAVYCWCVPLTTAIWQLYLLQIIAGMGNVLTLSILMGLCVRDISTDRRAAAMGFFQAIYGIGMTVGPIIMGFVVGRTDLSTGFRVMAAISVVTTAVTLPLLAEKKPLPEAV